MGGSVPVGTTALGAFAFALGLAVGSFLNVVIHRLPRGESLVHPRSRCPRCGAPIAFFDNVPVLSWIALRGRCRACRAPISARYPAVELLTGAVFLAIALRYGASPEAPLWMAFAGALIAAAGVDLEHQVIPDEISLGGLAAGLLAAPALAALAGGSPGRALAEAAAGALLGGGSLWAVGFAHARVSTALGRRFEHWPGAGEEIPRPSSLDYWTWFPGLGFGDVKLLAMIGAWVGVVGVIQTILAGAAAGLCLGAAFAIARRRLDVPFGFAPAIAAGALLVVLFPGPWL
jgi:leader peptidase (prepilin peptidase)/N-methyltransferase